MRSETSASPGPVPLYFLVEQRLRQSIDDGSIPPGAMLPTEADLCKQHGVSRITVRRALERLVSQGVVARRQGVGTFVNRPPSKLVQLTASLEAVLAPAPSLSQVLLKTTSTRATGEIAAALRVDEGAPLAAFNILHRGQEGPFSVSFTYVTPEVGLRVNPDLLVAGRPAVHIAESAFHRPISRAEQTIDADLATRSVARHLELKARTPLLRVTRVYFVGNDQPFAAVIAWYHPQRFRYSVLLLSGP